MNRIQEIIKLTAIKTSYRAADWLRKDERGTFEKLAAEYLEKTAERAIELNLSPDEVNDLIAGQIALDVLDTLILNGKGR